MKNQPQSCSITSEIIADFLSYSTAVFSRALPDCVDGLKVAQRRSLLGIKDLSLWSSSPYCKVSRLEGHVLGRYHPNGGCAGTIINLGQQSSQRYALTDIHGNCGGSIQTGPYMGQKVSADGPAAARYLEVRATPLTEAIYLSQIDRGLGEWRPNYDGSSNEPIRIVPALPALLLTGSTGIASGYAANHIPFRLEDVISASTAWIKNKKIADSRFFEKFCSPPEPPQGGRILRSEDFAELLRTGRGQIEVYGKWVYEDKVPYGKRSNRPGIIVTLLANGSSEEFVEKVHDLAEKEKLPGLLSISDHSTRDGIRVELILREKEHREGILRVLLESTGLRHVHNVNSTAVGIDGKPSLFGARRAIECWYEQRTGYLVSKHQREVENLRKEGERLEAVAEVLKSLDKFLSVVRKAKDKPSAISSVSKGWKLSAELAEYVIAIPISTLIATESGKVRDKLRQVQDQIRSLEPLCQTGSDLDRYIISELRSFKSLSSPSRSEWLETRPDFTAPSQPRAISVRDQIVEEAKSLGMSTRAINKWIRENVGGGVESRWAQHKKSVLGSKKLPPPNVPHPSSPNSGPTSTGRGRGKKKTVSKRAVRPVGEKQRSSSGKSGTVSSPSRSTGRSRSSSTSGSRGRTVSRSASSKGKRRSAG